MEMWVGCVWLQEAHACLKVANQLINFCVTHEERFSSQRPTYDPTHKGFLPPIKGILAPIKGILTLQLLPSSS